MRLRIAAAVSLLALALVGCRHRGAGWTTPAPTPSGAVELFVLGQARESADTRAVARALERHVSEAEAAGRKPLIIWLGTDFGARGPDRAARCPSPALAFESPALRELADVVGDAVERGGAAYGLPGPDGWRCGLSGFDAALAPLPYRQPGVGYVLRVSESGEVTLASSCDADHCTLAEPDEHATLELLLLDTSYWHYPKLAGPDLSGPVIAQQRALLDALREQVDGPPRVLLSPIPIETAGKHGLGGRKQRAAFHYAPPFVQQAIVDGLFVGVIGALERDLQVSVDLSASIIRGERLFIEAPVFQIISGAAGGGSHTLASSRGMSMLPDLHSEHAGFVSLSFSDAYAQLQVHARVGGRWRVGAVALPLAPEPLPSLRETPTIQACPSCDPQRGAADGDVVVPRDRRPH